MPVITTEPCDDCGAPVGQPCRPDCIAADQAAPPAPAGALTEVQIGAGEDTSCTGCFTALPAGAPAWQDADSLLCNDCGNAEQSLRDNPATSEEARRILAYQQAAIRAAVALAEAEQHTETPEPGHDCSAHGWEYPASAASGFTEAERQQAGQRIAELLDGSDSDYLTGAVYQAHIEIHAARKAAATHGG